VFLRNDYWREETNNRVISRNGGKKMKKILGCFGLSAVLGMLLFSNAWAEPQKISIELLAVEIPMDVVNEFTPPEKPNNLSDVATEFMGIDMEQLDKHLESLVLEKRVTLVAKQKLSAEVGKKTSFSAYRNIPYMEKSGEGTFRLKALTGKKGAGIFFEAFPTLDKDNGKINLEYNFSIRSITERVPVKGAEDLDIGLPILSTRESKSPVILNESGYPKTQRSVFYNYKTIGGKQVLNERTPVFMVIITAEK
jgi:hypothetical protein